MDKKENVLIGICLVLVLAFAIFSDLTSGNIQSDGTIRREAVGEDEKIVNLTIDAEGVLEEYAYELEVEPMRVTDEMANEYFTEAIAEIEETFQKIDTSVPICEAYAGGLVNAEWSFHPYGYISAEGNILQEEIPEDGVVITATAELSCGEYEIIYSFPLQLEKKELSKEESILKSLREWITSQMSLEGVSEFVLPTEIDGVKIKWTEQKNYLTVKILLVEAIAIICIGMGRKKQEENERQRRKQYLKEDYPDIVNQLVVLLGAGMTTRQAWGKIANQYETKRIKGMIEKRESFEEILLMHRRMMEGENERKVYQDFSDRIQIMCYRRLMRLLVNNLEKGTKGLCELLEEECRQSYDQRILTAKAKGEEASTKMLLPLMIMMMLVMAIVLMPAVISFSI